MTPLIYLVPQAVCDRLQGLASFLKSYLDRRQQRGYSRYASGSVLPHVTGSGGDGGAFLALPGGGSSGGTLGAIGDYYGSGSASFGVAEAGQQAAKRQRLTHAAMLEDERTARIR
jgi:hypothetical protein